VSTRSVDFSQRTARQETAIAIASTYTKTNTVSHPANRLFVKNPFCVLSTWAHFTPGTGSPVDTGISDRNRVVRSVRPKPVLEGLSFGVCVDAGDHCF